MTEPEPWDEAPKRAALARVANMLHNADLTGRPSPGLDDLLAPYAVQGAEDVVRLNLDRAQEEGRRIAGRAVMPFDGADSTFAVGGHYASVGVHASGAAIPNNMLVQPHVTAGLALRIGRELDRPDVTVAELAAAVDGVHAAVVVQCQRVGVPGRSTLLECVADNAHAGHVVLSDSWLTPGGIDLRSIELTLNVDGVLSARTLPEGVLGIVVQALRRSIALFGAVSVGEVVVAPATGPATPFPPRAVASLDAAGLGSVHVSHAPAEYEEGFEPLTHRWAE